MKLIWTDVISTSNAFLWTQVESSVAIICACLPTLKGLLARMMPGLFGSKSRSNFSGSSKLENYRSGSRKAASEKDTYARRAHKINRDDASSQENHRHYQRGRYEGFCNEKWRRPEHRRWGDVSKWGCDPMAGGFGYSLGFLTWFLIWFFQCICHFDIISLYHIYLSIIIWSAGFVIWKPSWKRKQSW